MAHLRDAVEVLVEERTGQTLIKFLMGRRTAGVTLRDIAVELGDITGLRISHETVRTWLLEG
jgi:hypothetical protein